MWHDVEWGPMVGALGTAAGLSVGAKVGIAAASVVVVAGAGGLAFAATDGFGMLSETPPSSESAPVASDAPSEEVVAGERPEDAIVGDAPATSMGEIFDRGQSVQCTYTVEGTFDATVTLKSMDVFRVDQTVNGGIAHIIRDEQSTLLWVDGMEAAEKYDTAAYEAMEYSPNFPSFFPAEAETIMPDDPEFCVGIPAADDALFTLPDGMGAVPGTTR